MIVSICPILISYAISTPYCHLLEVLTVFIDFIKWWHCFGWWFPICWWSRACCVIFISCTGLVFSCPGIPSLSSSRCLSSWWQWSTAGWGMRDSWVCVYFGRRWLSFRSTIVHFPCTGTFPFPIRYRLRWGWVIFICDRPWSWCIVVI